MVQSQTAHVKRDNAELTIRHSETDTPLIPVEQMARLHQFRPDAVDWLLEQTKTEADHRRAMQNMARVEATRVNTFIFINRIGGQFFALIIGLAGIIGGAYVAINDQPLAGGIIASLAITGLAAVFLTGRKK